MTIRAADLLVKCLLAHDVERVFCVPGESYLSVLDSLHDEPAIEVVTCRHEGGAGFMALGQARLRSKPAVLFVSRGPGCMNAAIAIHSAQQDASPLVVFIGQAERENLRREAFQGMNYERMFADVAKWVVEVNDASRLGDTICTAFHLAQSGTPGPVIISMPEDMLEDSCKSPGIYPRSLPASTVDDSSMQAVAQAIAESERPLVIAGGLLKSAEGKAALLTFAEHFGLPVATSVRHADVFPNEHLLFAGHLTYGLPPALKASVAGTDLIIAVGTRLGDVTSQSFQFPAAPKTGQKLIHIWPDENLVSRYRQTDIAISAQPARVLKTLVASMPPAAPRSTWTESLHRTSQTLRHWSPVADREDGIVFGNVVAIADELVPEDAIVCMDAGNFGGWVQRQFRFGPQRQLIGPSSGAMGYGIPSAVACSLEHPERKVICFVGDGGFLMTASELATARQFGAHPIIILSDNGSYGTIRMHQEKHFPGRVSATSLQNPDFVAMAKSYGAEAYRVDTTDDFAGALRQSLQRDVLSVIVVRTSLDHISPNATITEMRKSAEAPA